MPQKQQAVTLILPSRSWHHPPLYTRGHTTFASFSFYILLYNFILSYICPTIKLSLHRMEKNVHQLLKAYAVGCGDLKLLRTPDALLYKGCGRDFYSTVEENTSVGLEKPIFFSPNISSYLLVFYGIL